MTSDTDEGEESGQDTPSPMGHGARYHSQQEWNHPHHHAAGGVPGHGAPPQQQQQQGYVDYGAPQQHNHLDQQVGLRNRLL